MALEMFFLSVLYLLGVGYHVMQKIGKIKHKYSQLSPENIFKVFFKEEWNTLIVSGLGLVSMQLLWFIAHYENITLPTWLTNGGVYIAFLIGGYCLQRLIYKVLGTFEKAVDKQIRDFNGENELPQALGNDGPGGGTNPPPPPPPSGN